MKRLTLTLAVVTSTLFLAHSAQAQGGGGFGFGVGVVKFSDADDSSSSPIWVLANIRMKFNQNFALEPEAGWYRHSEGGYHTDVYNFGGNALLILPSEKLDAFFGGGLGGQYFHTTGGAAGKTYIGYHALGGIELKATDSLNFFGAIRYELVDTGDSDDRLKAWKFYAGIRFTSN